MSDAEMDDKDLSELNDILFGSKKEQEIKNREEEIFLQKEYERNIKKGGVIKVLAIASRMAKEGMKSDGLYPSKGKYGEWKYSTKQGIVAACYAREDVATTLILQIDQMSHLHHIKHLLWCCVVLLAYIAYCVS